MTIHSATMPAPLAKTAFRPILAAMMASMAAAALAQQPAASNLLGTAHAAQSVTNLGTIMPLGDSVTAGIHPGGYRDPLCTMLKNAGYTFKFVGSLTNNQTEALAAAGQDHHEGHSDTGGGTPMSGRVGIRWINGNLTAFLSNNAPDRILLEVGSNDMRGSSMRDQVELMSALVANIFAARPGVKLYVASVPQEVPGPVVRIIESFNKTVENIVAFHRSKGRYAVFVSMGALVPEKDMADYMHPNAKGSWKMAQAWYDALSKQ